MQGKHLPNETNHLLRYQLMWNKGDMEVTQETPILFARGSSFQMEWGAYVLFL